MRTDDREEVPILQRRPEIRKEKKRIFMPWKISILNPEMGVSKNNGTPKSSHFNRVFHYKPSILGYPFFLETSKWRFGSDDLPRDPWNPIWRLKICFRWVGEKPPTRNPCAEHDLPPTFQGWAPMTDGYVANITMVIGFFRLRIGLWEKLREIIQKTSWYLEDHPS